jgi:peroxiredoxin
LDLPKYESLDTQVLGVSTDVLGAQQAFAEKLGLTYPLLSDVSRDTVKQYGVMDDDPNSAYFRLAKRAYVVIDTQGRHYAICLSRSRAGRRTVRPWQLRWRLSL